MLFAEFFDDFGPRSGFVAQDAAADRSFKRLDHSWRKTMWISREGVRGNDASHLPVAGSSVFASRQGSRFPENTVRPLDRMNGQTPDVCEAHSLKIRNAYLARAECVPERVGAFVTIIGGIGHLSDANAIEHDEDDSVEGTL